MCFALQKIIASGAEFHRPRAAYMRNGTLRRYVDHRPRRVSRGLGPKVQREILSTVSHHIPADLQADQAQPCCV